MTFSPDMVGDKGQRYAIQCIGWPMPDEPDWQTIGFSDNMEGALRMRKAVLLAPSVERARIWDREAQAGAE